MRLPRPTTSPALLRTVLVAMAAVYVVAGGVVHLLEWSAVYRQVPAELPGSSLVRIGFPITAAVSLVVAGLLVATLFGIGRRLALIVIVGALAFQVASLLVLVQTRLGSVLSWMEPAWTGGAQRTAAVEGAAIALLAALALLPSLRRRPQVQAQPVRGR